MAFTVDGSNGLTFPDSTSMASATQLGLRNRIINGAMMIDQRNAGAAVTPSTAPGNNYFIDRWTYVPSQASKFTLQQVATTALNGFQNYLSATVASAVTVGASDNFSIRQYIEGFNFQDLNYGTSDAKTVTLSFWVRSSLTGSFGGSFANYAGTRSYPFAYTINSANTWEYKTITMPGDTSGTWVGATNAGAAIIHFGLGSGSTYTGAAGSWTSNYYIQPTGTVSVIGTAGATWFITGVQLERGSAASPFDWRPYGTEFALCQRYYCKSYDVGNAPGTNTSSGKTVFYAATTAGESSGSLMFPIPMRAAPTVTYYTPAGTSGAIRNETDNTNDTTAVASSTGERNIPFIGGNRTSGKIYSYQYTASAEL